MADAYRNIPLEQRISSLSEGDVTHYGTPIRSRRLTVQPRKKTDVHYHWQEGSATGVDPDAPKVWAPIYPQTNQDITTRLRIIHCAADDLTPCGTCLPCQAAAEIQWLRIAGDLLAAALRVETVNGQMAICDGTNEAFQAWEEARHA